jgi:hypothetical protein
MSIGNLKDTGNQGNNFPWQLKVLQGLQEIANQTAQPLTCAEDSVSICADGDTLTSTTIGADTGLDVNIIGGVTLEVNLDATNDQVGIYGYINGASGSPVPLNVNASGQVAIQDGGNSITVDGTVTANAGTGNFNVTQATASSLNATVVGGTGVSRTPNFLRPSTASPGTGTVAVGAFSASFASVGTANALVGGMVLKTGETLNFDAGAINNTLAAITYDVTTNAGAELIIITLT